MLEFHKASDARKFIFSGRAVFTAVSRKTGNHLTFQVKKAKTNNPGGPFYVKVRSGSIDHKWKYIGHAWFWDDERGADVIHGKEKADLPSDSLEFISAEWLLRNLTQNPESLLRRVKILHEGKCGRCRRQLTDPVSIERGLGPECAGKA